MRAKRWVQWDIMGDLSESNVRAGKIAVGAGMVDQGTVDRALHLLEARDSPISLAELLLQLGHITPEQFKELMALHYDEVIREKMRKH